MDQNTPQQRLLKKIEALRNQGLDNGYMKTLLRQDCERLIRDPDKIDWNAIVTLLGNKAITTDAIVGQMLEQVGSSGLRNGQQQQSTISTAIQQPRTREGAQSLEERKVHISSETKRDQIIFELRIEEPKLYHAIVKKKEGRFSFDKILKRALTDCAQWTEKGYLKSFYVVNKAKKEISLFRKFEAAPAYSTAGIEHGELLKTPFVYRMLPDSITILAKTDNIDDLLNPRLEIHDFEIVPPFFYRDAYGDDNENSRYLKRFMRFLKYYQGIKYSMLKSRDLKKALKSITNETHFYGIRPFMEKFGSACSKFATKFFSAPKGLILYGPPGTGKSAISEAFCSEADIILVTDPIAPGDLNKGLKGDSEATINAIANRARIVPWEMVVVLIDEIDRLAPDREDKAEAGNGQESMLGVFNSILDGYKKVGNLKVFGSTNLLHKIDMSFRRRMEIQLFLGNPTKTARQEWIFPMAKKCEGAKRYDHVIDFVKNPKYAELREDIVNYSINFSADEWRKFLEKYYEDLLNLKTKPNAEDYKKLMFVVLEEVVKTTKNELGGKMAFKALKDLGALKYVYDQEEKGLFHSLATDPRGQLSDLENYHRIRATHKVLVSLAPKTPSRERFQVHFIKSTLYQQKKMNVADEGQESLCTFKLLQNDLNKENWLALILDFALAYDADTVKLIDHNFLQNQKAYDDQKAQEVIHSLIEETKLYNRAVLIFDLDSITQIDKNYSSMDQDPDAPVPEAFNSSFSYSLHKPNTYADILQSFKSLDPNGSVWFFAVARHNKLLHDFKVALNWPNTESDHEFIEEEKELDKYYRCKTCGEIYTPRENMKDFNCGKHRSNKLQYNDPNADVLNKKQVSAMTVEEARDRIKSRPNFVYPTHFTYTCCGGYLDSKGCLPCRHIVGKEYSDDENDCKNKVNADNQVQNNDYCSQTYKIVGFRRLVMDERSQKKYEDKIIAGRKGSNEVRIMEGYCWVEQNHSDGYCALYALLEKTNGQSSTSRSGNEGVCGIFIHRHMRDDSSDEPSVENKFGQVNQAKAIEVCGFYTDNNSGTAKRSGYVGVYACFSADERSVISIVGFGIDDNQTLFGESQGSEKHEWSHHLCWREDTKSETERSFRIYCGH